VKGCYLYSKTLILIIYLLVFLSALPIKASEEWKDFQHFSQSDGLSSLSVTAILQDSTGFVWIGTEDGLYRFDGYRFKEFKHNPLDSNSLCGFHVTDMLLDKKGRIWISTMYGGISVYSPRDAIFHNLQNIPDDMYSLSNNSVVGIECDGKYIWAATYFGLNRIDTESFEVKRYVTDVTVRFTPDISSRIVEAGVEKDIVKKISRFDDSSFVSIVALEEGFRNLLGTKEFDELKHKIFPWGTVEFGSGANKTEVFSDLLLTEDSRLFVSGINGGLRLVDAEKGTLSQIIMPEDGDVFRLKRMHNKIYVLCFNGKLLVYDDEKGSVDKILLNNEEHIVEIFQGKKDELVISTERALYSVQLPDKKIQSYSFAAALGINHKFLWPYSLPPVVTSAYQDKAGNMWYGTENGLFLVEQKKQFNRHYSSESKLNALKPSALSAMYIDRQDDLWVGYFDALVDVFSTDSFKLKHHFWSNETNVTFGQGTPQAFCQYNDSLMLVGSYQGGLCMYDIEKGAFSQFVLDSLDVNHQGNHDVRGIAVDADSMVWLALHGGGLTMVNMKDSTLKRFRANYVEWEDNLHHDWLEMVFADSWGTIWTSSSEGYSKLRSDDFSVKSYKGSSLGLTNSVIICMYEDEKGIIWVGTDDGLFKYVRGAQKFVHVIGPHNSKSFQIVSIIEDNNGELWLGTQNGIINYKPESGYKKLYRATDGLHTNEFLPDMAAKNSEGKIFFGGKDGITSFFPEMIVEKDNTAPIVYTAIESYSTDSVQQQIVENYNKKIPLLDEVTLPFQSSVIRIEFALLNFGQASGNVYSYKMKGIDDEWHLIGNKNEISFSSLPPGKYKLMVKAKNENGVLAEDVKELKIHVVPRWWQTLFFRLMLVLFLLVFVYLVVLYRIKKIEKQKAWLASEVQKRTADLSAANQRVVAQKHEIEKQAAEVLQKNGELEVLNNMKDKMFSVVSHDIKNPLGVLMGYSDLLLKRYPEINDEKRLSYIHNIDDVSKKLYALLMNLLDWSRSQSGNVVFRPGAVYVDDLIDEVVGLYRSIAESRDIRIHILSNTKIQIEADHQLLSSILRNLISNAIKFTPEGGEVTVSTGYSKHDTFCLSVADTGDGMSDEIISEVMDQKTGTKTLSENNKDGTGLGLMICNEFVRIHKGEMKIKSELGSGTVFSICLPLGAQ